MCKQGEESLKLMQFKCWAERGWFDGSTGQASKNLSHGNRQLSLVHIVT